MCREKRHLSHPSLRLNPAPTGAARSLRLDPADCSTLMQKCRVNRHLSIEPLTELSDHHLRPLETIASVSILN